MYGIKFAPLAAQGHNPFRVDDLFDITQGSSFLATLGYTSESRWDSRNSREAAKKES